MKNIINKILTLALWATISYNGYSQNQNSPTTIIENSHIVALKEFSKKNNLDLGDNRWLGLIKLASKN